MDPRRLTDELFVCAQLSPEDINSAAALGYKSIVNNRPDNEQVGQPTGAEIAAAAEAAGLEYRHIPIEPGQITDDQIDQFADALARLPAPVLAFCRTGTRSVGLYSLAEAGTGPSAVLIARANAAGYDISGLQNRLEARRGRTGGSAGKARAQA